MKSDLFEDKRPIFASFSLPSSASSSASSTLNNKNMNTKNNIALCRRRQRRASSVACISHFCIAFFVFALLLSSISRPSLLSSSPHFLSFASAAATKYKLSQMNGTWFPTHISEVVNSDPYQYFLITKDTSVNAIEEGYTYTALFGSGGNPATGASYSSSTPLTNYYRNETEDSSPQLLTYAQAVASCEAIGGTILSNFNYFNLGLDGTEIESRVKGIDPLQGIWFGLKVRRTSTSTPIDTETDIFVTDDGRPILHYPSLGSPTPMTNALIAEYFQLGVYSGSSLSSYDCYALSLNGVVRRRIRAVPCGGESYLEEVTVPMTDGDGVEMLVPTNITRIRYTKALAVCQRPYTDSLVSVDVPKDRAEAGLPDALPAYINSRSLGAVTTVKVPVAPQSRWVRAPLQFARPSGTNIYPLNITDDLDPSRPRGQVNVASTRRESRYATPMSMSPLVFEEGQPVDHVLNTIEVFVSPIKVSSYAEAVALCDNMDAQLAVIPNAEFAARVVFPAVAALHRGVGLSWRAGNEGEVAAANPTDGTPLHPSNAVADSLASLSILDNTSYYIGCHYPTPPGNNNGKLPRFDHFYQLENTSMFTAVGASTVYANGGGADDVRQLGSFSTRQGALVGGSSAIATCLTYTGARPAIGPLSSWLGFGWGRVVRTVGTTMGGTSPLPYHFTQKDSYSPRSASHPEALIDMVMGGNCTTEPCAADLPSVAGRPVICTRQVMRVTAELVDGTDIVVGSTIRLRLSLGHLLKRYGSVVVAVTVPTQLGVVLSTSVVNFTAGTTANTQTGVRYDYKDPHTVDIGMYIPTTLPASSEFAVTCSIVYPTGAGINPVVRWIRSRRDKIDGSQMSTSLSTRALNIVRTILPYAVTFSPSSLRFAEGETLNVTAQLSRPSRNDFVIASDFSNQFVSAPILVFPRGTVQISFQVYAKRSSNESFLLNFTGVPLNTSAPLFGVPSADFFYLSDVRTTAPVTSLNPNSTGVFSLAVTVDGPASFSWGSSFSEVYDDPTDYFNAGLTLSKAPIQEISVAIMTNCTPYFANVSALKFTPTTYASVLLEMLVTRRLFYREIICNVRAVPSLETQSPPPLLHFRFRKRTAVQIERFPLHSFTADGSTVDLKIDQYWMGTITIRIDFAGDSCPSPAWWIVTTDSNTWKKSLSLPEGLQSKYNCSTTLSVRQADNPTFNVRRTIVKDSEMVVLPYFTVFKKTGSSDVVASVHRVEGDPRDTYQNVQGRYMVWMPEGHNDAASLGLSTSITTEAQANSFDFTSNSHFVVDMQRRSGSTKKTYQLAPIYDSVKKMFYSYFYFSPQYVSQYTATVTGHKRPGNQEIDLGRYAVFDVRANPKMGALIGTDSGASASFPSDVVAQAVYTVYYFPTAPFAFNASYVTMRIRGYQTSSVLSDITAYVYGDVPSIPQVTITIPSSSAAIRYQIDQSVSGSSLFGFPFRSETVYTSDDFTPSPTVIWNANTTTSYTGGSFQEKFCHGLTFNGPQSISVRVTVEPAVHSDAVRLTNGSSFVMGPSNRAVDVCVEVIAAQGSFKLIASPQGGSGSSGDVEITFAIKTKLRFLRLLPLKGYSRHLLLDRWPTATPLGGGSAPVTSSLVVELETFGEKLASSAIVNDTLEYPYNGNGVAGSENGFIYRIASHSTLSKSVLLTYWVRVIPVNERGGHTAFLQACDSSTNGHLNCATLFIMDPPTLSSAECLMRPNGYVPSYYGGYSGSSVAPFALPSVTLWNFNNNSNASDIDSLSEHHAQAAQFEVPLGLDLTASGGNLAFARFGTGTVYAVKAFYNASLTPSDFTTVSPITVLVGGDGGTATTYSQPYDYNAATDSVGNRMDPSTSFLRHVVSQMYFNDTSSSAAGELATDVVHCWSGAPLWTIPAHRPALGFLNTTMRVGRRGELPSFITVAPPPWYASVSQSMGGATQQEFRMRLSAVGVNSSTIRFEPSEFILVSNTTQRMLRFLQSMPSGFTRPNNNSHPDAVNFDKALLSLTNANRYWFRMYSESAFGAANISLQIQFTPKSPFYRDVILADNITVLPLLRIVTQYDPSLTFFGCRDYITASFNLIPVSAHAIQFALLLNNSKYNISASPLVLEKNLTKVNFTVPDTACTLLQSMGNATDFESVHVSFETSGPNALQYSIPDSVLFVMRAPLWVRISKPSGVFYAYSDNAIVLTVSIEARPKEGRRLVLIFNCEDTTTLSSDDCRSNVTNITFTSTSPSLSLPVLWSVQAVSTYRVWLTVADMGAPEYLPVSSEFTQTSTGKKATLFTMVDYQYTHLPAGKWFQYELYNPQLEWGENVSATVSANVSGVLQFRSGTTGTGAATHSITLTHAANNVTFWVGALPSVLVVSPVSIRINITSVSSTTISQEASPTSRKIVAVPQLVVNFTTNNPFFYIGTQDQNLITFSAPLPYNRDPENPVTTRYSTTSVAPATTIILTTTAPSPTTTVAPTTAPGVGFGPIMTAFFTGSRTDTLTNFSSGFQSSHKLELTSNTLRLVSSVVDMSGTTATDFSVCWYRDVDNTSLYAFEYRDAYIGEALKQCLFFTAHSQADVLVAVDADWYVRDTLEVYVSVPTADLNRCRDKTTVEITTQNPALSYVWTRNASRDFVGDANDLTRVVLSSLLTTAAAGPKSLSWTIGGSCFNFRRPATPPQIAYTVHSPTPAIVSGFPSLMFIGEVKYFNVFIEVKAFHDGSNNRTQFHLLWNGNSDVALLAVAAGNAVLSPTAVPNQLRVDFDKNLTTTLNFSIQAKGEQTSYATWNWSVVPNRDRYIGAFVFSPDPSANRFIIPKLQKVAVTATHAAVNDALLNPEKRNNKVFVGEQFCIEAKRESASYGVNYSITLHYNSSTFELTDATTQYFTGSVTRRSFCLKVLKENHEALQYFNFTTTQTNNLYLPLSNISVNATRPIVVRITNGTWSQLVCGQPNTRVIELTPDRAPERDNIVLNFTVYSPDFSERKFFSLRWNPSDVGSSKRYISLNLTCAKTDVTVYVIQTFSSFEFTPAAGEGAFSFRLMPLGTFSISNLRTVLFNSQTMLIDIAPSRSPVQFPLTIFPKVSSVTVEPESLTWAVGDASPKRVELIGNSARSSETVQLGLNHSEFESLLKCTSPTAAGTPCALEVVNNANLKSFAPNAAATQLAELIIFVGYPQEFDLGVVTETCSAGTHISARLEPFEYQDTMLFSPNFFNFTCGARNRVTISGLQHPTLEEQNTQVLIVTTQSFQGAAPFNSVNALGLNIIVRTPAPIHVEVSSGGSLFVGRRGFIVITLPRPPSGGWVNISASVDNAMFVIIGAPLGYESGEKTLQKSIPIDVDPSTFTPGMSVITLNMTGLGNTATQFYFTQARPFSMTFSLQRQYPFSVQGGQNAGLSANGKLIQGISYGYRITVQEPPRALRDEIQVIMRFVHTTRPSLAYTYNVSFKVGQTNATFNFTFPEAGNYSVSGNVTGSQSYADRVTVNQSTISIERRLEVVVDDSASTSYLTQYMHVGQNNIRTVRVLIPSLTERHYYVGLRAYWAATDDAACRAMAEPSPTACARATVALSASNFIHDPNTPLKVQESRLSFSNADVPNICCTLFLAVSGSEEISKTPIRVADVLFKPLNSIVVPSTPSDFSMLVNASVTLTVNVTSVPPFGIVYPIGPPQAVVRGVIITPPIVNITSDGIPSATFTIRSTAEGVVTIPFSCKQIGGAPGVYTFEENKNLDVTIRTLALLEPQFSSRGIAYRSLPEGSTETPQAISLYVGSANAVVINVTFPSFYRYNAPDFLLITPLSTNVTFLTATFAAGGNPNLDPSLRIRRFDVTFPYYAQLTVTGNLKLSEDDTAPLVARHVDALVIINSSTNEYRSVSRIRMHILPLFTFILNASFVTLYSGSQNVGFMTIKPSCTTWPPELAGKSVAVGISSTCSILDFERSKAIASCDPQRVSLTATGGGECTIGAVQSTTNRISLFTTDAATMNAKVVAQPQLSHRLYVSGQLLGAGAGITDEQVRTQGITVRIFSSSVGFASDILVTPFNESSITIASTQPNSVYGNPDSATSTSEVIHTGFWRALTTELDVDLNNDGTSRYSYADVVRDITHNDNRSAIRWSISATAQQDELTILVNPLKSYTTDRDEIITIRCKRTAFIDGAYPHPLYDMVSFKILAGRKAVQTLVKREDAANTVFAAASISSVMSAHAAISSMQVLTVVTLNRCPNPQWRVTSQDSMDFFMFPLRKVFPFLILGETVDDLGTYAGAILGNSLIIVAIISLHAAFVAVLHFAKAFTNKTVFEVLSILKFPSLAWYPAVVMYVPTVVSCVRVMLYSASPSLKVIGSFAMLIYVILIPAAAVGLTAKSYQLVFTQPARKGIMGWLLAEGYYKHKTDPTWIGRYADIILPFRGEARWFFAADVILMAVVSFTIGVIPEADSQCLVRNIFLTVIFFVLFVGFLLIQPMSRKADNFFFALIALLQAVTVALMTSQGGSRASTTISGSNSAATTDSSSGGIPSSDGSGSSGGVTVPVSTTAAGAAAAASAAVNDFFGSTDMDVVAQNLLLAIAILCLVRASLQWLEAFARWSNECSSLHKTAAHDAIFGDSNGSLSSSSKKKGGEKGSASKKNQKRDAEKKRRGDGNNLDDALLGSKTKKSGARFGNTERHRRAYRLEQLRALHQSERMLLHDDDDEMMSMLSGSSDDDYDDEDYDFNGRRRHRRGGSDESSDSTGSSSDNNNNNSGRGRRGHGRRRGAAAGSSSAADRQHFYDEGIAVEPLDEFTEERLREMGDEALATAFEVDANIVGGGAANSSRASAAGRGGVGAGARRIVKMKGFQRVFDPTVLAFDSSIAAARRPYSPPQVTNNSNYNNSIAASPPRPPLLEVTNTSAVAAAAYGDEPAGAVANLNQWEEAFFSGPDGDSGTVWM